jgi:hypothetical protein
MFAIASSIDIHPLIYRGIDNYTHRAIDETHRGKREQKLIHYQGLTSLRGRRDSNQIKKSLAKNHAINTSSKQKL